MFYENVDFHVASLHTENKNNHACIDHPPREKNNRFRIKHPEPQERLLLNVVLIGDRNIGKSKLIEELLRNTFVCKRHGHSLDLIYQRDERSVEQRLQLSFQSIDLTSILKNDLHADCLLFVYDTSKSSSFEHLTDFCLKFARRDRSCSRFLIGIQHPFSSQRVTREQIRLLLRKCPLEHAEVILTRNHRGFIQNLLDHYFQQHSSDGGLMTQIERQFDSFRSRFFS
jgi:GTPase SAR1 family protein